MSDAQTVRQTRSFSAALLIEGDTILGGCCWLRTNKTVITQTHLAYPHVCVIGYFLHKSVYSGVRTHSVLMHLTE